MGRTPDEMLACAVFAQAIDDIELAGIQKNEGRLHVAGKVSANAMDAIHFLFSTLEARKEYREWWANQAGLCVKQIQKTTLKRFPWVRNIITKI